MAEMSYLRGWRVGVGCASTQLLDKTPSELQLAQEGFLFCFLETKDPAEIAARR